MLLSSTSGDTPNQVAFNFISTLRSFSSSSSPLSDVQSHISSSSESSEIYVIRTYTIFLIEKLLWNFISIMLCRQNHYWPGTISFARCFAVDKRNTFLRTEHCLRPRAAYLFCQQLHSSLHLINAPWDHFSSFFLQLLWQIPSFPSPPLFATSWAHIEPCTCITLTDVFSKLGSTFLILSNPEISSNWILFSAISLISDCAWS